MKDFSNASFPPDTIAVMTLAMNAALLTLPHPVSSRHVQSVAETILRTAKEGERNPRAWSAWRCWNFKFRRASSKRRPASCNGCGQFEPLGGWARNCR